MKQRLVFIVYSFVFLVFVFQKTAYAYIDPGAVSVAIQAIAASVLVGGAAIGIFFSKIKSAFYRKKNVNNEDNLPDKVDHND